MWLQSFIIMKDRMQAQGMDVRASLDAPEDGAKQMEMGKMGGMGESRGEIMHLHPLPNISAVS
jgi:hypothetical protein